MAEAETQEEVTDKGAVNVVKLIEDQNSYINSAKERMNDVISALVNNFTKNTFLNFGNSGTLARLLIGILSTTPNIEINSF